MFLIEDGKAAILYTGDIRAEPWWVNSIARNPVLVAYSSGILTLDKIYLDTTCISLQAETNFPSKAQGIKELLEKVAKYPASTVFHFHAWTYGYEDIFIALSSFLRCPVRPQPFVDWVVC